jgi:hypothetical protein
VCVCVCCVCVWVGGCGLLFGERISDDDTPPFLSILLLPIIVKIKALINFN